MNCPGCGSASHDVHDSRPDGDGVRRRRVCRHCSRSFTTLEVVVIPDSAGSRANAWRVFRDMMASEGRKQIADELRAILHPAIDRVESLGDE